MERKFSEQELTRRQKLEKLVAANHNPFEISAVDRNHTIKTFIEQYQMYSREQLQGLEQVATTIAGRVRLFRDAGKAAFVTLSDFYGSLQLYIRKDEVGPDIFNQFEDLDIGDLISVTGIAMRTNMNELTLRISDFKLVSKALRPLPDKHDGLKDKEERYRRRYVDLIMNEDVRRVFIQRSKILQLIRQYLILRDYYEVETPILQTILGGAAAKPFTTYHNTLEVPLYLRIAPELYLKRLLVGGFEKVFEMGRLFRNEGMSARHNPEYTSIEVYVAYVDMHFMMDLTEKLINFLVKEMLNTDEVIYDKQNIKFNESWTRIRMVDAIKAITQIDFDIAMTFTDAKKIAKKYQIQLEPHHNSVGHIILLFFEHFVEETLIQPTFIYDYPIEVSPLAKKNFKDPRFTDRFELFIGKREYANGYSELNDPIDQYNRFQEQLKLRELGDQEANEMDLDFVEALEYAMPPAGGLGIGIDRLVMLLTKQESIKDVLLFPTMKPRTE